MPVDYLKRRLKFGEIDEIKELGWLVRRDRENATIYCGDPLIIVINVSRDPEYFSKFIYCIDFIDNDVSKSLWTDKDRFEKYLYLETNYIFEFKYEGKRSPSYVYNIDKLYELVKDNEEEITKNGEITFDKEMGLYRYERRLLYPLTWKPYSRSLETEPYESYLEVTVRPRKKNNEFA